jgi:hypothetical protein
MIDVEVTLTLIVSLIFTLLYYLAHSTEAKGDYGYILYGAIAIAGWFSVSFLWFFLVATPTGISSTVYDTYAVAYLYMGIAILHILSVLLDTLNWMKTRVQEATEAED